ncbi:unnamed protein product [Lepidochelys kempii]
MMSCGLLTSSKEPVPLHRSSVSVLIRGFVADVGCQLLHRNEELGPVEAVFKFPVDAEAAVDAFQAWLRGACIQAHLQEKRQAQELYGDALAGGQSSFLLQQEEAGGNVFSCSLGNLPPGEEAMLTLSYTYELLLEHDGAARYVLPTVLHPRYTPHGVGWGEHHPGGPVGPPRGAALHPEPKRHAAVAPQHPLLSSCPLTPLSYTARDLTTAQVSLAQAPPWDRDLELLVYYTEPPKPSAVLEAGLPGAEPGLPNGRPDRGDDPAAQSAPGSASPEPAGEFILLLGRSGSTACPMDAETCPASASTAPRDGQETLVLLLKSFPLGCYFNIYGFGSEFESFYPQSVENTQQTKAESLKRLQLLQANLGAPRSWSHYEPFTAAPAGTGTHASPAPQAESPAPPNPELQASGHSDSPKLLRFKALFVFTDEEAENTQDIIAEVQHHRGTHKCFSFGIRDRASTALIKGFARGVGGSAEFITSQDCTQPKVPQSLKWAMQPALTGISLSWDLPPEMQAELLHWDPEVIFAGQRCLVYAQLRGQPQPRDIPMGGITLQYRIQDQTYKETLQFSLQPQDGDRLPVHRLAAKSLLLELEGAVGTGLEGDGRRVLEASLSSGVVCSLTAYMGVDMERGQLVQGLLVRRDVLLAERAPEESPLLRLVSLQNANVWWNLDPRLAAVLGVSGTNARVRIPSEDVTPSIWATVLAMVWLHGRAVGQPDESSCWRPRLWAGCGTEQGAQLSECLEAANALLGCNDGPAIFGL